jgi:hypothetical protein
MALGEPSEGIGGTEWALRHYSLSFNLATSAAALGLDWDRIRIPRCPEVFTHTHVAEI